METKLQKCKLHCRGLFIVNEKQSSTKWFYKNEIPIKEFIINPSFIFTKNELLHRFFKLLCPIYRTPILQSISWTLFLKQTGGNYGTYLAHLQPMFHLNPLKTSKNQRFSDVYCRHRRITMKKVRDRPCTTLLVTSHIHKNTRN